MSLSIVFHGPEGTDGPYSVASASGWAALAAWAEQVTKKEGGPLAQLVAEGECVNTLLLARQIRAGLKRKPPDAMVLHTIRELIDLIGVGDREEIATVIE